MLAVPCPRCRLVHTCLVAGGSEALSLLRSTCTRRATPPPPESGCSDCNAIELAAQAAHYLGDKQYVQHTCKLSRRPGQMQPLSGVVTSMGRCAYWGSDPATLYAIHCASAARTLHHVLRIAQLGSAASLARTSLPRAQPIPAALPHPPGCTSGRRRPNCTHATACTCAGPNRTHARLRVHVDSAAGVRRCAARPQEAGSRHPVVQLGHLGR